jgi:3-hydroxyisobutyrate dehydrogenase-like beta-hydroxyacid dehydrogenase
MKVGFIGSGRMGRPMVDRLRAAGHDVTVLVRRAQARDAAEADGLEWAETVAATVDDADVVVVVVLRDDQVRDVCLGPDGAVGAMKQGATLVQHTTSDPATARQLAKAGAVRGIRVLDAAISGGPHDIAAGTLTLWVGGEEAVLDEMRPVLATYASPVMFVGPPGNGQRVTRQQRAVRGPARPRHRRRAHCRVARDRRGHDSVRFAARQRRQPRPHRRCPDPGTVSIITDTGTPT